MATTTTTTTAVDPDPSPPLLRPNSIPTVDLRLLSQSDLYSLSNSSSSPHLHDVVIPKIDRSVFNESAGSRKQTYSRLRLAPPSNSSSPSSSSIHRRMPRQRPSHSHTTTPPLVLTDNDHADNSLIISAFNQLFAFHSDTLQSNSPTLPDLLNPQEAPAELLNSEIPELLNAEASELFDPGSPKLLDTEPPGFLDKQGGPGLLKTEAAPAQLVNAEAAPAQLVNAEAPTELVNAEAPAQLMNTEAAPAQLVNSEAPAQLVNTEAAPAQLVNAEAPAQLVKAKAPAQLVNADAPAQLVNAEAPAELVNAEAPAELVNAEAPAQLVNNEAPAQLVNTEVPEIVNTAMKRKRGRPRKNESAVVAHAPAPAAKRVRHSTVKKMVVYDDDKDREIVNSRGVKVNLVDLGRLEDPYGEEIRRRTEGLLTADELLGFLRGLNGQWGTTRKKRRVVDASDFGDALPKGWRLSLCIKRKEGHFWLFCRRYISPSGRQFASCKDISVYLLSLLGEENMDEPKYTHSNDRDALLNTEAPVELLNPESPAELLNTEAPKLLNTQASELLDPGASELSDTEPPELLDTEVPELLSPEVPELLNTAMKRKRGRPRKNENAVVVRTSAEKRMHHSTVKKVVAYDDDKDREVVNSKGVKVNLMDLGRLEDPYGEEIRWRTEGLSTVDELLGFLRGLNGQWGTTRKKRRVVDASDFGDALPKGWRLSLCIKKKEGHVWLFCRRYISPGGRQFESCKDISTYLLSLLGEENVDKPNYTHSNNSDDSALKGSPGNAANLYAEEDFERNSNIHNPPTSPKSLPTDCEKHTYGIVAPIDLHVDEVFKCLRCFLIFEGKSELWDHQSLSHKDEQSQLDSSLPDWSIVIGGIFVCNLCHNTFYEINQYNGHVGTHVTNENKTAERAVDSEIVSAEADHKISFVTESNMIDEAVHDLDMNEDVLVEEFGDVIGNKCSNDNNVPETDKVPDASISVSVSKPECDLDQDIVGRSNDQDSGFETRVQSSSICEEKGFEANINDAHVYSTFDMLTTEKGKVVYSKSSNGQDTVSETRAHTSSICEEKGYRENINDMHMSSSFDEFTSEKGKVVNNESSSGVFHGVTYGQDAVSEARSQTKGFRENINETHVSSPYDVLTSETGKVVNKDPSSVVFHGITYGQDADSEARAKTKGSRENINDTSISSPYGVLTSEKGNVVNKDSSSGVFHGITYGQDAVSGARAQSKGFSENINDTHISSPYGVLTSEKGKVVNKDSSSGAFHGIAYGQDAVSGARAQSKGFSENINDTHISSPYGVLTSEKGKVVNKDSSSGAFHGIAYGQDAVSGARAQPKGFPENINDTHIFSPFGVLTSEKGKVVNKDSSLGVFHNRLGLDEARLAETKKLSESENLSLFSNKQKIAADNSSLISSKKQDSFQKLGFASVDQVTHGFDENRFSYNNSRSKVDEQCEVRNHEFDRYVGKEHVNKKHFQTKNVEKSGEANLDEFQVFRNNEAINNEVVSLGSSSQNSLNANVMDFNTGKKIEFSSLVPPGNNQAFGFQDGLKFDDIFGDKFDENIHELSLAFGNPSSLYEDTVSVNGQKKDGLNCSSAVSSKINDTFDVQTDLSMVNNSMVQDLKRGNETRGFQNNDNSVYSGRTWGDFKSDEFRNSEGKKFMMGSGSNQMWKTAQGNHPQSGLETTQGNHLQSGLVNSHAQIQSPNFHSFDIMSQKAQDGIYRQTERYNPSRSEPVEFRFLTDRSEHNPHALQSGSRVFPYNYNTGIEQGFDSTFWMGKNAMMPNMSGRNVITSICTWCRNEFHLPAMVAHQQTQAGVCSLCPNCSAGISGQVNML